MPLTVLTDRDVSRILHSFTREDIEQLQETMADALHWYSTSNDENDYCSDFQPERTHLQRKDGSTTLFMPASGLTGQGVKVVSIVPPDTHGLPNMDNLSLGTSLSSASSLSQESSRSTHISFADADRSSTPSIASTDRHGSSQPSSTNVDEGSKKAGSTIRGSLTLLDGLGNTTGLINAEEVTAFRTALCSTMMLKKRHSVHDVTVFGAGKQAYWHIRLALILRGPEIHHMNIINRSFDSARNCIMRLYDPLPEDPNFVNPIGDRYNSKTKKTILTPSHTEYERLLKEYVRGANVIFCTVPSTQPLFPATYLTNPEGRKKGRYIACIGSYKPHMLELHPDLLRYAVAPHHEHRHVHKRQKEGGAIVVDTVTGCLKEAGEIIQAGLQPDQVVELGELFMLRREAERAAAAAAAATAAAQGGGEKLESGCLFQNNSGLKEWLTRGNVIYKSVGLGLMDVVVGNALIEHARRMGVGTTIEDF